MALCVTDEADAVTSRCARSIVRTGSTRPAAVDARFIPVLKLVRTGDTDTDVVKAAPAAAIGGELAGLPVRTRIARAAAVNRRFIAVVHAVRTRCGLAGAGADARAAIKGTLAALPYCAIGLAHASAVDVRFAAIFDRVRTARLLTHSTRANLARAISRTRAALTSVARRA